MDEQPGARGTSVTARTEVVIVHGRIGVRLSLGEHTYDLFADGAHHLGRDLTQQAYLADSVALAVHSMRAVGLSDRTIRRVLDAVKRDEEGAG